jgi:hypothetical protein
LPTRPKQTLSVFFSCWPQHATDGAPSPATAWARSSDGLTDCWAHSLATRPLALRLATAFFEAHHWSLESPDQALYLAACPHRVRARIIERGPPVGPISFFPQPKQRARWTEVNRSCAGRVRFRRTSVVCAELRNGSADLILVQVFKYLCGAALPGSISSRPRLPSNLVSCLLAGGRLCVGNSLASACR